ncbi:MAG: four helix bundle protein [Gemmatimonadaceae bacterium]|nr:four helix bundle protein [Gemmatimonadaceae bacterium]
MSDGFISESGRMEPFKRLRVWRKAHALAINTHRVAAGMRSSLAISLRSQMVRAAMSIPTNIVEGRGQKGEREFARFLRIALNSGSELQYHLIVARELKMISERDFTSLSDQATEVRKMIHGLLSRLAGQSATRTTSVENKQPEPQLSEQL